MQVWNQYGDSSHVVPVPNWTPGKVDMTDGDLAGSYVFAAGGDHFLIVGAKGQIFCFGSNKYGECGHQASRSIRVQGLFRALKSPMGNAW